MGSVGIIAAQIAAGLVLLAGLAKLYRPADTRDALALTRLPAASWLVRTLGVGEILLAVAVLALGGRELFGLLAIAYVGFVVVAERQRRAGRGCGCFGASTTTVGPLHLGVDATAALAAAAAAWQDAPGLLGVLPEGVVASVTTVGLIALAVALAQLTLTALPELLAVRATAASASPTAAVGS